MAITNTNFLIPVVLTAPGTLTVKDDYDQVTMGFGGVVWKVQANIGVNGTTSGNTDFVVEKDGTDMWTPAAGCGRIAHDSSALYLEWDWENANWTGYASGQTYPPTGARVDAGDVLQLNVNVIPGGSDSVDLKVTLWIKPFVD